MVRIGLSTALLAAAAAQGVFGSTAVPEAIPGAYIIEYEDDVASDRVAFSALNVDASVRTEFNSKIFKGVAVDFADVKNAEETAAKVAANRQVKNVWPIRSHPLPRDIIHSTGTKAEQVASALARRQAGGNTTDTFSTHLQTQVNKLRDAGIRGKGVRVAVVDTGIDYKHPALGGCFGPGCLVAYGYDLVGDNYTELDERTTKQPDNDPMDECNGHGTHVAGIIAAQSGKNPWGIVGAAEDVTLGAYRVFSCRAGGAPDDVLIDAYLKAWEDGSDIITASIGGPQGWPDGAWDAVVSRIVAEGVPCLLSAGNDGDSGIFFASTAADSRGATAIGSVDNSLALALINLGNYSVDGVAAAEPFAFIPAVQSWTPVTLPLWAVNFNTTDTANGCAAYPANTPDLSGYIVLIRRGTCTFADKVAFAAAKGAKYILFYNNVEGTMTPSLGTSEGLVTAAGLVLATQGETWVKALAAGSEVTVTLTDPLGDSKQLLSPPNTATPGTMSQYSSWGPTYEVNLKPQFSAPGGLILSTYPRALGSYAVLSGTSMSCPIAAAIYALLINVRGTKDPETLENIVSSTSKAIIWNPGSLNQSGPYLAPVPQQGGGLMQAWDAAYAKTLLGVSSISFNDSEHFVATRNFSIHNTGSASLTYKLANVPAGTVYTFGTDGSKKPLALPQTAPVGTFASLNFSSSEITIGAGERRFITVTATPPTDLDAERIPVYSGFITINGTDGTALSLPYLGVVGNLRSIPIVGQYRGPDTQPTHGVWITLSTDRSTYAKVASNATFMIPEPGSGIKNAVYPKLALAFNMGSNLVHALVVPVGRSLPSNATEILGVQTLGEMAGFPKKAISRATDGHTWKGELSTGGYAPAGAYKIVVKALRIFGDPKDPTDWDTAETQPFRIAYEF
ncbi:hypothetical protein MFIFM68171_05802 [Madurella fahalii]|uniref:Minor extracellular protease vpr n=1 Tax=Madurella fahalii TaxID=1157608 RepID=A0ABQ0GCV4_9PEZI